MNDIKKCSGDKEKMSTDLEQLIDLQDSSWSFKFGVVQDFALF